MSAAIRIGVVQQAGRDTFETLRLIFELRHPLQLTDRRDGVEQPLELAVFRDVRLHEQDRALRVDTRGEQPDRHVPRPLRQTGLVVLARDGVQVHHADRCSRSCCCRVTQFCTAPSQLPMCSSPDGWIPENMRGMAGNVTRVPRRAAR